MKPIRSARLAETTPHGVLLDCGAGLSCRVSLLLPDLGRVVFLRHGKLHQRRTWSVLAHGATDTPWEGRDRLDESAWPAGIHTLTHAEGRLVLSTAAMTLTISLDPFGLSWALPDGTVFAADRATHPVAFGKHGLSHAFARNPSDNYHGLGDKTGPVDLHGRRLRITALDSLGYNPQSGDPLYKHWPFLIVRDGASGVAHGLYYDNLADAAFDLGCAHDNYFGLYRSYEAEAGDLDYFVFPGPGIVDVTRKFLRLTGKPALPPRWTLGFAQTAMGIADAPDAQARMEDFIATCRREQVPVSSFHFGSGYTMIGPKRYVFTWNRQKYPDPPALMRSFHAAGMHVVANLKPCLLDDHPRYAEPADGYIRDGHGKPVIRQFWDGEGAHLDFTSQAAIAWWKQGVAQDVLGAGIDAAWNDNNEYGFTDDDAVCAGFGEAFPLELGRPLQSLLMTRASLEATVAHRPQERPFTICRAGMPGLQRYAQTWTGDNDSSWHCLAWNLRMGLTMSLSGLGNTGHDIGGFSGPIPDAELVTRFAQACAVHPRMIMNSWKPGGVFTTPWLYPQALPAIRAAIRLRYRLIPYLYSLMHRAAADGTPPLLPPFAVFEADAAARADSPDLMLGPFLLAAPVVEPGARARDVYLPAGPEAWFDFWSGEALAAGRTASLAAPLDRLPLAVAAGGILPMADGADFSRLHDEPARSLRIYPGHGHGESRFTLVEDDGISTGGVRTEVHLHLSWTPHDVTLTARTEGGYHLPYHAIGVALPAADRRTLHLGGLLEHRPAPESFP